MNTLPEKSNGLTPQHPVFPHVDRGSHPKKQVLYMRRAAQVFAKYKKMMLIIFVVVFGLIAIGTFLIPPTYSAKATLILERNVETEKAVLFGIETAQLKDLKDWLLPEMEILRSGPVLNRVVSDLNLHQPDDEKLAGNEEKAALMKSAAILRETVLLENPRKSNVINVTYENTDPALASEVVNDVIKCYQNYRKEIYSESQSFTFFQKQLTKVEAELKFLEDSLSAFKKEFGVVSPDAQIELTLRKLSEYQRSLTETRTDKIGRAAKLAIIRENLKGDKLTSIPVLENTENPSRYSYWSRIRLELLNMEMRRDSLVLNYTEDYEGVRHLDSLISVTKGKMFTEVQQILAEEATQIDALAAKEKELNLEIAGIQSDIKTFSEKEVAYANLNRAIENKKEVVEMLEKQKDEAGISQAKELHGIAVRVVNAATVPIDPIKPLKKVNLAIGFLLALFLALGAALTMEFFDNTIDTPEKIERYINLPVLATVSDCEVDVK